MILFTLGFSLRKDCIACHIWPGKYFDCPNNMEILNNETHCYIPNINIPWCTVFLVRRQNLACVSVKKTRITEERGTVLTMLWRNWGGFEGLLLLVHVGSNVIIIFGQLKLLPKRNQSNQYRCNCNLPPTHTLPAIIEDRTGSCDQLYLLFNLNKV